MIFNFKEFSINQDKTAMKVGTDSVLLGSWCSLENNPESILDIGSGTGLLALMMAQRSEAMNIDAVEIDENAFEQSVINFEQSVWGDRLYCYHSDFEYFAKELSEEEEVYNLIITNPPFFTEDFLTPCDSRNKARFATSLSFEILLDGVVKILDKDGVFSLVLPFKEEENFIKLAKEKGLYINRICRIKGNPESEIKRSLLEFSFINKPVKEDVIIIEKQRHQYTEEYINLTKDFYIKM